MQEPEQIDLEVPIEDDNNTPQFVESDQDFVCFDDQIKDDPNDQNQS
jgi:hypothetical protein